MLLRSSEPAKAGDVKAPRIAALVVIFSFIIVPPEEF